MPLCLPTSAAYSLQATWTVWLAWAASISNFCSILSWYSEPIASNDVDELCFNRTDNEKVALDEVCKLWVTLYRNKSLLSYLVPSLDSTCSKPECSIVIEKCLWSCQVCKFVFSRLCIMRSLLRCPHHKHLKHLIELVTLINDLPNFPCLKFTSPALSIVAQLYSCILSKAAKRLLLLP